MKKIEPKLQYKDPDSEGYLDPYGLKPGKLYKIVDTFEFSFLPSIRDKRFEIENAVFIKFSNMITADNHIIFNWDFLFPNNEKTFIRELASTQRLSPRYEFYEMTLEDLDNE